ncbi:MAG TPA: glycosyltransferase family 2 protein [Vicinamibacterales bacterium]|nr:glycosyltransferase family 2 protein [Vicinamibacterales bacterium]
MALPSLSIVVPVYNAEHSLAALVERLHPVLSAAAATFEVILVDDGSRDGSWRAIEDLHARYGWVRGMRMMRNYGQHNATLCGIRDARGDVVVTMDDDLQHPPEQIPVLLAKLEEGYDVVYGSPSAERHGLWRDLASRITKLALQSVLGATTARQVSGFRALRTHLRQAFADFRGAFVSIDVLLTWSTTKFTACRVPHEYRKFGRSNYTFFKLVIHALNMLTGFSTLPLQFASLLGFAAMLLGMGLLAMVLVRYLIHGVVMPGFTFLASVICLFSGTQLFTLGMMGEYLARVHDRTLERPIYAVAERTSA